MKKLDRLQVLAKKGKYKGVKQKKKRTSGQWEFLRNVLNVEKSINFTKSQDLTPDFAQKKCREKYYIESRRKLDIETDCKFCGKRFKREYQEVFCSEYCRSENTKRKE